MARAAFRERMGEDGDRGMSIIRPHLERAVRTCGHRILLCEPDHFAVGDEMNVWMDRTAQPCRERFLAEWLGLLHTLESLGVTVEAMPAVEGLPTWCSRATAASCWTAAS
jgi:hypothetical protein